MSSNKCVLLVDDDTVLLKSLSRSLESMGLDVETCSCIAEARILLRKLEFDCILCDHNMPGGNGLDFLEEVSKTHPDTDRFMLSGMVAGLDVAENWARDIGVKRIFSKPFDAEQIAVELSAVGK